MSHKRQIDLFDYFKSFEKPHSPPNQSVVSIDSSSSSTGCWIVRPTTGCWILRPRHSHACRHTCFISSSTGCWIVRPTTGCWILCPRHSHACRHTCFYLGSVFLYIYIYIIIIMIMQTHILYTQACTYTLRARKIYIHTHILICTHTYLLTNKYSS